MKKLFLISIITSLSFSNVTAQKLTAFKSNKGLCGFMDSKTKAEIIKPQYNDAHGFSFGYAAVKKNGKWFYIDKSGKNICEHTFDKAGNFDEYGVANVSNNGKWGELYYGSLMYNSCTLMQGSAGIAKISEESYKQEEKLGWSKEEYDGTATMVDGVDWDAYSNTQLAKTSDELFPNKTNQKTVKQKKYHPNGILSGEGNEVNGKKEGEWKFYNQEGILFEKSNWKNDVAQGNYTFYFTIKNKITPMQTGYFVDGKKDGEQFFYHPNGKKSSSELWNYGTYTKMNSIYDKSGNLISSNGSGNLQTYYSNGQLKFECNHINGFRNGVGIWYYDNGVVMQKVLFKYDANKNSHLTWEIIETNTSQGKPLEKGTLTNGNGTIFNYDKNNKLVSIITYVEGKAFKKDEK